jgi:two-component system, LytTR family, response regulator
MTALLRVVLADDEPLASQRLRRMLEREPQVAVVAECETGAGAVDAVQRERPDILFLDVQMPEGDGFDVVGRVGHDSAPLIVFVTAFDEFAVRAFESAALDYLVKPVRRDRLRATLDRARDRLRAQPSAHRRADRMLIDRGQHMDVVNVDDIDWVESADNDVIVHIGAERHRFRRSMEQVLARLPDDRFARVHRSAIVNLSRIRQVHPWFHGNFLLVLADGARLTTGRVYREQFLQRMHLLG